MRPSSVHSLHCLEPRSYWSPRKTFRYCNHYFIQRPVDARTEREAGWGPLSVAKNLPLNLPSLSAHDGWIGVLFFFLFLFVCMFALLRIKAKSWPMMIMSQEKKRAIPRGKNWLILSARAINQNTRYFSFTMPPREGKGEGTQTITKLLSCEGSFGLACTSVSYLFLSLSLIKRDLVSSFQLANIRFSRFCKKKIQ